MPLTKKGAKIMRSMTKQYGVKKAKEVFFKMVSKGTITGVEKKSEKRKSLRGARKRK